VFQSPRMSDGELKDFYQAEYRQLVQDDVGPTEKDRRVQAGRARNLLKFVRKYLDLVRSHLDIGSSAGTLLEVIRKKYNCASVGVEPGEAYRTFSQERGLEVVRDLDEIDAKHLASFDLVSMAHVLEHLPDPVGFLRNLREGWMVPGGYLLIEVPNINGHTALEVSHLTAYSSTALRRLLNQAGYQIVALEAHGRPRSRLIPLYLTVLAQVSSDRLSRVRHRTNPRGILARRKIGMFWARSVSRILPGWAWLPWPELDE
ncbi:MAG: class I SAM-dependent methyltransferase, partial [Anaerolineaceae bacterium]